LMPDPDFLDALRRITVLADLIETGKNHVSSAGAGSPSVRH
jgi:hypothetical protein